MNVEDMTTDDVLQALGEIVVVLNHKIDKLCHVIKVINQFQREMDRQTKAEIDRFVEWGDDLGDWLEANLDKVNFKYRDIVQLQNKATYLENEQIEIKKLLGMLDGLPTINIKPKKPAYKGLDG